MARDPRLSLAAGTALAAIATAGSLYVSLGLGLVPCELCWYQRILMYPLVVVLGVATVDRRRDVYRTALPLSVSGLLIAAYHSSLQLTVTTCGFSGDCAAVQLRVLGLTVPNLSLITFALITGVMAVLAYESRTASAGSTTSSSSG